MNITRIPREDKLVIVDMFLSSQNQLFPSTVLRQLSLWMNEEIEEVKQELSKSDDYDHALLVEELGDVVGILFMFWTHHKSLLLECDPTVSLRLTTLVNLVPWNLLRNMKINDEDQDVIRKLIILNFTQIRVSMNHRSSSQRLIFALLKHSFPDGFKSFLLEDNSYDCSSPNPVGSLCITKILSRRVAPKKDIPNNRSFDFYMDLDNDNPLVNRTIQRRIDDDIFSV